MNNATDVTLIEGWSEPSRTYYKTNASPAVTAEATVTSGTTDWQYVVVSCQEGDIFTVSATGGSAPRAWAFCDNDYAVIERESSGVSTTLKEIVAPENATKLILNRRASLKTGESFKGELLSDRIKIIVTELEKLDSMLPLDKTQYALIPDNTDYDDLTTVGAYYVNSLSSYNTMTHQPPMNGAHLLIVQDLYATTRKVQIAMNNNVGIYLRFKTESWEETWTHLITNEELDASNRQLYLYNVVDVTDVAGAKHGADNHGIIFTYNSDGTYTISGQATDTAVCNIISSASSLPSCVIPGDQYMLKLNDSTVPVQLYIYYSGSSESHIYTEDTVVTVPSNATGVLLRFRIASGSDYSTPETVKIQMLHVQEGTGSGGVIHNTYNITTSPTITTDTNGWLQAIDDETTTEANSTDMTGAIMSMLTNTGYCHLGEGIFYVSGSIDMPEHSLLCGCGDKTQVRLLSSVTTGYVVKIQRFCAIKDIAFSGSATDITPSTGGTRNGINFVANYDGSDGEAYQTNHCMIDNVWIRNFSGSGIYCHNTSINYAKGIYATNVFIHSCGIGVNIDYYSEFNKFTNVCIAWCYIACVNNGGNNVFTACTFHARNTGFYIDGNQPNAAHGTLSGCTFCHIGSNTGKAVDIKDVTAGFVISNCQFWYNSINVKDSAGILFTGCEFGRGTTGSGATINIDGGDAVIFSGCLFNNDVQRPPVFTITNNTKTVLSGCYGGVSGNAITLPA